MKFTMSAGLVTLHGNREVNQNTQSETENLEQVLSGYLVQSKVFTVALKSMLFLNRKVKWLVRSEWQD